MASSDRAMISRQVKMAELQEDISTGIRVNRPSDDSSAYGQARRLEGLSSRYGQYQDNIESSESWVNHTQDALNQLVEQFQEIYERGIASQSNVFDADDRDAEATRIEDLIGDLTTVLNAKEGEEYLFAGSRTKTPPFAFAGTTVTYNGDTNGRARQISDDVRVDININGDQVLNTGAGFTITESVEDLAAAIRAGDATQFETALGRVITARDHLIDLGSEAGSVVNRLDAANAQLREADFRLDSMRSLLEDTDMTQAIVEFQEQQTGLQAALKVTSQIMQTSLIDYIR